MVDHLDSESRSALMRRIRGKDTVPEMIVRRAAHRLGLRFRLHRKDLVGTPDLVFPSRRTVVFVHGCFWHQHPGCVRASRSKTRPEYWRTKLERNVARDNKVQQELEAQGWRVIVIWECETRCPAILAKRLAEIAIIERCRVR